MSLDLNALVRAVKKAAVEAVRAENPMGVCHGTVTGLSPLEITTDQKLILGEKQLILTNAVRRRHRPAGGPFAPLQGAEILPCAPGAQNGGEGHPGTL